MRRCGISGDYTLEFLLAFNGRIHHLERGYWLKFAIRRVEPTGERPHGLRYSFTLHDPAGERLMGFDNAHPVTHPGRYKGVRVETDHWHRTKTDPGRPYEFTSADQLLVDFFEEVTRILGEIGIDETVIGESTLVERKKP